MPCAERPGRPSSDSAPWAEPLSPVPVTVNVPDAELRRADAVPAVTTAAASLTCTVS